LHVVTRSSKSKAKQFIIRDHGAKICDLVFVIKELLFPSADETASGKKNSTIKNEFHAL